MNIYYLDLFVYTVVAVLRSCILCRVLSYDIKYKYVRTYIIRDDKEFIIEVKAITSQLLIFI